MEIIDHIIVRYGEITLKKRNRKKFIKKLEENVKRVLGAFPKIKLETRHERMIIFLNGENYSQISEKMQHVFGIHALTPAVKVSKNMDEICKTALKFLQNYDQEVRTFKVETKRVDKTFPFDSYACNRKIGGYIFKNAQPLSVDVHNPDVTIRVEIKEGGAHVSGKSIACAGGLPLGSSSKALLMLSGGIDSPVAGYQVMRRGVELECVHFASPPYTSERAKQKAIDLAQVLFEISGKMTLHIVPFTEIQKNINEHFPSKYNITITKRIMLKITEKMLKKRKAFAIVTGDNLGQVASQTTESIYAINAVTSAPIFRPLLSCDKNEIIKEAKRIGTYDISIRPYEDCCTIFKPSNSATKPVLKKVLFHESKLDFAPLIDEAIKKTEEIVLCDNQNMLDLITLF